LLEEPAAETCLADYYLPDKDREATVTRWWSAVERVVKTDLLDRAQGRLAEWLRHHPVVQKKRAKKK
jgi:hypothetical protein